MNIEEMISYIKKRPGMYVGELRLSNIEQFIKGFMFNNAIVNRVEEVDVFFKIEFPSWSRKWLNKNYGLKEEFSVCWTPPIIQVVANEQEAIDLFFTMIYEFYDGFHKYYDDEIFTKMYPNYAEYKRNNC